MTPRAIRARAPLRISFAGGGTDVPPFVTERGGHVLNATLNRYAYATLVPNETGRVVLDKPAEALLADDDVREFYLGLHPGEDGVRRSFRDTKHYRRKKRWSA